jgi:hypothetical protein
MPPLCVNASVTAALLREKLKAGLCVRNTENALYHQTEHCRAGSIISHNVICTTSNVVIKALSLSVSL